MRIVLSLFETGFDAFDKFWLMSISAVRTIRFKLVDSTEIVNFASQTTKKD